MSSPFTLATPTPTHSHCPNPTPTPITQLHPRPQVCIMAQGITLGINAEMKKVLYTRILPLTLLPYYTTIFL